MTLHIITDSTSDLSQQQAKTLGITVVPLTVQFGAEEFTDGIDLTPETFYEKMRQATELPKTSQVNVATFMSVFEAVPTDEPILGIFISSELSGTFQAAKLAADTVGRSDLYLVDSRQVTFGLAALVHVAIRRRQEGVAVQDIVAELNELKTRLVVHAMIPDLKYLKMGGRLSSTSATIGTMLRLKPIVEVRDGRIEVIHKTLGNHKAYEWIAHQVKHANIDDTLPRFYGQSDAMEALEKFKGQVEKVAPQFQADAIFPIGITVGTHAGPGCVALSYFKKSTNE